ncbi:IclR family transcriptional regulator [Haladaptatus sp. NG-SE-30]
MTDRMPVKTPITVFKIVEALLEMNGARFTDLVDYMEMPQSTLHDHLRSLESIGAVVKNDKEYRVGTRFLEIGARARHQHPLFEAGHSQVEKLAIQTGEHASLSIEERGRGILLYVAKGENAVNLQAYPGRRTPLHTNAAGKVMLAHFPEERVDEIIDRHGLSAYASKTITDRATLKNELEQIRERGYATDTSELVDGVRAISAPIIQQQQVIGTISVGGPANRMRGERFEETIPDSLLSASNIIELDLTYG